MSTSRPGKRKNMEVENANHNNKVGGKKLVAANDSGQGLPYAPVDWPEPGDIWSWKVGSRTSLNGHFIDRYLFLPTRLQSSYKKNRRFASKRSLKEFIVASFPNKDVDEFLSSFCWKIPSAKEKSVKTKGTVELSFESVGSDEIQSDSDDTDSSGLQPARCKAGNKRCNSLVAPSGELKPSICQMCCKSDSFCRDCCCTICSRIINILANGGLDYVRCADFACGHIVHVNCALQTFMAGTIGGCIDLDAECLCRPCNSKTDLIPYVEKLLKASQSSSSVDDVLKSLRMCANLLYGSTRTKAKNLLSFVRLVMGMIKTGTSLEDVWKVEGYMSPSINAGDEDVLMITDGLEHDEEENQNKIDEERKQLAEKSGLDGNDISVEVDVHVADLIDSSEKKMSGDEANEEGDGKENLTMGGGVDTDVL